MNPLLSLIPFLTFVAVVVASGSIIGAIAKRKHRNPWLWKAAGAFGFLVALVAFLCFKDLNSLSEEEKERSRLKEKIVLIAILLMWTMSLFIYFQAEQ